MAPAYGYGAGYGRRRGIAGASTPTIHIANAGNDTTGNGTEALPYATLAKAVSVAGAADIIGLNRGDTWREMLEIHRRQKDDPNYCLVPDLPEPNVT